MNRLFDFSPHEYHELYAQHGYVHVPRGLTAAFHEALLAQVEKYQRECRLEHFALGGKQQSLYQFPDEEHFSDLLDYVSAVTGLSREKLILSERHIKAYEPDAQPDAQPHKDRYASEVSVGFSVTVPEASRLVFYPRDDVSVNRFNSAREFRESLTAEQLPENVLPAGGRVEIKDQPGDVFMFRGNAIWHGRLMPANTTMVYLKLNTFNCDPLGEDPRSDLNRQRTLALADMADYHLRNLVPLQGSRVDYVQRRLDRQGGEMAAVVLWNQLPQWIDARQFALLQACDGETRLATLVERLSHGADHTLWYAKARELARLGALDLRQVDQVVVPTAQSVQEMPASSISLAN